MPTQHVASLREIESGYWWYVGRIEAAVFTLSRWARGRPKDSNVKAKLSYIDIGCGTGGFAAALKKRLPIGRAAMIDADAAVLILAKAHPDFEVHQVDISKPLQLPFAADIITCMDVIEHLNDDQTFLNQLAAKLSPESALLVSAPAFAFLYSEWDKQLGHYRRYTARELRQRLEKAGLRVREIRYTWSFLMPLAPYRKLRAKRYRNNMEFEKAPAWANAVLIQLAKWESQISRFVRLPFGTSVMALATKI